MKESEKDILNKYRKLAESHVDEGLQGDVPEESMNEFSQQYVKFKSELLTKKTSTYENLCNSCEKIIKLAPGAKLKPELERAIQTAHLNITPEGAATFPIIAGLLTMLLTFAFAATVFLLTNQIPIFITLILVITALILMTQLTKIPVILATRWRLKASNQMVLCILYVVIYMRHTSNLEHAIKFAAEHIEAPLSLDLRKVFWDVETGKYSTIKESLDSYLETWRHDNLEFVTAFHLIESSLYEPTQSRRSELLDKSLNVILEGSYEKMLHYAQDIKGPITTLYMLGIILPILGLVVFPLIGSFLQGLVKWYHLAFIYNLILPGIVYMLGTTVLSKRPTGYGSSKTTEDLYKQQFNPLYLSLFIFILFLIIGLLPIFAKLLISPSTSLESCPLGDIDLGPLGCFMNYIEFNNIQFGPFGIGALILSFFIPAGAALSLSYYYNSKSKKLIELRNETKSLESEFSSALFQLGNRIGDGIPTELAFSKVSQTLEGTPSGDFFRIVDTNIRQLGMGLKQAIFNEKNGAILAYPSPLIESSMEVLLESSTKGPKIVSQSLTSISLYVDKIHKVSERLKDLLAEVISSMKAQISFLTPAIAGIVVGISTMIVNIIVALNTRIASLTASAGDDAGFGSGGISALTDLFGIDGIIPGYYFQLVVGLYVIQLAFILTILQNGIENGPDKLNEQYLLGKNIRKSFIIYATIALIVTILFSSLAMVVLGSSEL